MKIKLTNPTHHEYRTIFDAIEAETGRCIATVTNYHGHEYGAWVFAPKDGSMGQDFDTQAEMFNWFDSRA